MITVLSITACLSGMIGSWFVSRGTLKIAYTLGILTGSSYTILNALIAMRDPSQYGVIMLIVPSAWGIAASLLGLRRLEQQKNASRS